MRSSADWIREPHYSCLDNQLYVCFIRLSAFTRMITGLFLPGCSVMCLLNWFALFEIPIKLSTVLILLYPRTSRGSSEWNISEVDSGGMGGYLACVKLFVLISVHLFLMKSNKRAFYPLLLVFNISALRKVD